MSLAVALSQPTEYDRAVEYARRKPSVSARTMAKDLALAPAVCTNFLAKMEREGIVAPANDLGRRLVIVKPRDYAELEARSKDLAETVIEAADKTGMDVNTLIRAAEAGVLQEVMEDLKTPAEPAPGSDAAQITSADVITGAAQTRLRTIVERIERLEEDKAVIAADISEVYSEAKGEGFDTKILRKVIAIRKKDKVKRDEENAILDLYLSALGM
jgi:uncharacterized protein (UPF0335 family)/DNA-binding transcriptional regulator YhcF (GntR family)